jgi:hypothetical protein
VFYFFPRGGTFMKKHRIVFIALAVFVGLIAVREYIKFELTKPVSASETVTSVHQKSQPKNYSENDKEFYNQFSNLLADLTSETNKFDSLTQNTIKEGEWNDWLLSTGDTLYAMNNTMASIRSITPHPDDHELSHIYDNTLVILDDFSFVTVNYLKTPPDEKELTKCLRMFRINRVRLHDIYTQIHELNE